MINRDLVLDGLVELADSNYQERVWTGPESNEMASFATCTKKLFTDSGLSGELGPSWFFGRGRPFGPIVFSRKIDMAFRMLRMITTNIGDKPTDQLMTDPRFLGCRNAATWILEQISDQEDP